MKKYLFLTVVFLIFSVQVFSQEVFENKQYEFSMQIPKKWLIREKVEILENQKNIERGDEESKKISEISKSTIRLIALQKYNPKTHIGILPVVLVSVRPFPAKDFQIFKNAYIKSFDSQKTLIQDFEFIEEPKEVEISGIKAVYLKIKSTVKYKDGGIAKAKSRIYAIPYKNYFFQITMNDGQTEEDCTKEFDELVKTIKIGK
jgi:hypothetical protein